MECGEGREVEFEAVVVVWCGVRVWCGVVWCVRDEYILIGRGMRRGARGRIRGSRGGVTWSSDIDMRRRGYVARGHVDMRCVKPSSPLVIVMTRTETIYIPLGLHISHACGKPESVT